MGASGGLRASVRQHSDSLVILLAYSKGRGAIAPEPLEIFPAPSHKRVRGAMLVGRLSKAHANRGIVGKGLALCLVWLGWLVLL